MWLSKNERKLLWVIYTAVNANTKSDSSDFLAENNYPIKFLVNIFQKAVSKHQPWKLLSKMALILNRFRSKSLEIAAEKLLIKSDNPSCTTSNSKINETISLFHGIGDIRNVLNLLKAQNLIEWKKDQCQYKISMTYKGFCLGHKYSNWFTRTGLWFAEYKDHWMWLILSFLGGIISSTIFH